MPSSPCDFADGVLGMASSAENSPRMGPTEGYESGFETDGGNNSDTGSERGHSQRKYENAVLKIVQRVLIDSNIPLLKGVGEGASALVTRESRQALMTEVKRRMRTDRGVLRSILRRRREDYHETARAHEKMERRLPRIPGAIGVRRAREGIQRRWRYTITGAEDVRVRDHYGGKLSAAAWSKCPLGSAPARLLCLLRALLVALGGSVLPERG